MKKDDVIMWEQFVLESPWLSPVLPSVFDVKMDEMDINFVKSFDILDNFGDHEVYIHNGEMYFVSDDKMVAYYRYEDRLEGGVQTKMTWNSKKFKGTFFDIFANYILPTFGIVESDTILTSFAFDMWKKMIMAYPKNKYYAKDGGVLTPMTSPWDVHEWRDPLFGKDDKHTTFIAIYEK